MQRAGEIEKERDTRKETNQSKQAEDEYIYIVRKTRRREARKEVVRGKRKQSTI